MKQLKETLKEIYQPAGLNIHDFKSDLESQDYGPIYNGGCYPHRACYQTEKPF